MTAFLDRIAFWRREPALRLGSEDSAEFLAELGKILDELNAASLEVRPAYFSDFGANNIPVEDLGGKPVYYENNQPVYPGREKAP